MSAAVLERSYERTVRVAAPQRGLYREMDSVGALVRFLPQVDGHVPGPDDSFALCRGSLSIGLLSYRLRGSLRVERVIPPHRLRVVLRAPRLRLELAGMFEFSPSAEQETTLTYAATIRSSHPFVRRMDSWVLGTLEEHVDSALDLIVVRAAQYAEAERRFNQPYGNSENPDERPDDPEGEPRG